MVSLDETVLDLVEANPREWVVRIDGRWSHHGLAFGVTPRWYFQDRGISGSWWSLTEDNTIPNYFSGTTRWNLKPSTFRPDDGPVTTGELVHISLVPQEVQLRISGFRPDVLENQRLRERGGVQQRLDGWTA